MVWLHCGNISIHIIVIYFLIEKVNCLLKENERQPSKKKPIIFFGSIFSYFVAKEPFKKDDV
jgi:hypothetical protein